MHYCACSEIMTAAVGDCAFVFFFSSRRRHTRFDCDWSSDVCSSDLAAVSTSPPPGPGASGNSSLSHTTRLSGPGVLGGGAAVGVNTGPGGGVGASTVAAFSVVVPGAALPSQALRHSAALATSTTRSNFN